LLEVVSVVRAPRVSGARGHGGVVRFDR